MRAVTACLLVGLTSCGSMTEREVRAPSSAQVEPHREDSHEQKLRADKLYSGLEVRQDYPEAARLYLLAAEQGHAGAQFMLASMYEDGEGVAQNDEQAVRWLQFAARQGEPLAQSFLAQRYAEGRGLPRDYVAAHMWANLSVSRAQKKALADILAKTRDDIAAKLAPNALSVAQQRAAEWRPESWQEIQR